MNKIQDFLTKKESPAMEGLYEYVNGVKDQISASSAAIYIIQGDQVIGEWYAGADPSTQKKADEETRYNVFSVRKSYIGLAVAILLKEGKIASIDEPVSTYLGDHVLYEGLTIRHLVTHTHGLDEKQGIFSRIHPVGEGWDYNNGGLSLLYEIIRKVSGKTVSKILDEHVFNILQFTETGWETKCSPTMTADVNEQCEPTIRLGDDTGFERNLFVSARELAHWGYLHLKKGRIKGTRVLEESLFDVSTAIHTPISFKNGPQNGFFWFQNENNFHLSELGEELPPGSYQILGASGCTCLVIPEYEAVAVRMLNKRGNPPGYDYLKDVQTFGNRVNAILSNQLQGTRS
ncbi:beta-lactamase family protein [Rossellomorea aquimaris]|uniref:serine hydrolase domain-containing protein n=1 Tax=Rossellomorea aquimaris TaxID=189382 RepID=UPI001CD4518A|nr:serine hydrolase domain-containing protein [Rossellomorea aquimaris]MCA1053731.1 beta-lactamase family protein [Rossellomorea aquimaris]